MPRDKPGETKMEQEPVPADEGMSTPGIEPQAATAAEPGAAWTDDEILERVRYGLGKELRLYPAEFAVVNLETHEELRVSLGSIRRLILAPGDPVPSKLVLMFDLDDGNTIIAAEGMSNVKDFRRLLARLTAVKPDLELDPPNMDEQLVQALDIRRRSLLGCYGSVVLACFVLWVVYMAVALLPHVAGH
jgi:hypothetical protein